MKTFNAVYDITEKDLVMIRWHRLKCEAAMPKQPKRTNWITKILKLVR